MVRPGEQQPRKLLQARTETLCLDQIKANRDGLLDQRRRGMALERNTADVDRGVRLALTRATNAGRVPASMQLP